MSDVSVVMSVYDEPEHVKKTIESVLKQEGVSFEFVIVSDGASDAVISAVNSYLDDERVCFIKQKNQGLTVALINGCKHATSPFIARIDAGDVMHPTRLLSQANVLKNQEQIGIVSSLVNIETVEGEFLYSINHSAQELDAGLRAVKGDALISPFHASVMFRRSVYNCVGGYRAVFYFTQDVDLSSRMIEQANISVIEEVLTKGIFSASGISGRYRHFQTSLCDVIADANLLRQAGKSDQELLEQAEKLRPSNNTRYNISETKHEANNAKFDAEYFLASVLSKNKSKSAKKYWWRAFKLKPMNLKVWVLGLLSLRHMR